MGEDEDEGEREDEASMSDTCARSSGGTRASPCWADLVGFGEGEADPLPSSARDVPVEASVECLWEDAKALKLLAKRTLEAELDAFVLAEGGEDGQQTIGTRLREEWGAKG